MYTFDLPKEDKEYLYKLLTLVAGLGNVLPKIETLKVEHVFLRLSLHTDAISLNDLIKTKTSYEALLEHYELDKLKFSLHYLDFKQETVKELKENQWVIILYPRFERGK